MKIRNTVVIVIAFLGVLFGPGIANAQETVVTYNRTGIYLGMFPLGVSGQPGTAEFVKYSVRLKLFGNSTRNQGGLAYFRTLDGNRLELDPSLASSFGADTLQFEVNPGGAQEIPLASDGPLTFGSVTLPTDIIHFDMSDPLNSNVLGVAYLEVRDKDGGLLSSVPVALARPATKFLADAEFTAEGKTWLAVFNPIDQPVVVTVTLAGSFKVSTQAGSRRDSDGLSKNRTIGPGETLTAYLDQIFAEVKSGVFAPTRLDIFSSDGGVIVVNAYRVGKQVTAVPVFPLR